jgi:serine/threonine protein kinase/Tfp pilus assembly protein PilF
VETALGLLLEEEADGTTEATQASRGSRATRSPRMLTDFGDYELLEEIGCGGQGVVYRARQKSLNRIVALKVIGLAHWATEAHVKRFRLEAEAAARLDDRHIVPIYEVGERDGACYFSMKFIEGGQLDKIIGSELMPPRKAAKLTAKLARTLHYAHEHGVLHRDVKPGNILLDAKGEPYLTDFGLARLVESESTLTRTLEVMGTPSYMAPEQAAGNTAGLTGATDVYGLGAVFYQLLTGHPPFAGGTSYETVRLVLETEPRQPWLWNPKVDRDLATICLKCLEKEPQRRYASALALAEDLERWLRHEPIYARRAGVFIRGRKWVRRNPITAALILSLTALAAVVGVIVRNGESIRPTAIPEKSVAVLPFENLSDNKQNSHFADGVQDEILSDLAKIADLKVISRTSVMQYKSGIARNLREIGQQLAVAHLVEGSVQWSGNRVRVNAQLIDVRTDGHLWGQTYDRELSDVFAIQSEIAKTIADQLQAKISPAEKNAIERPPTSDVSAFNLHTRGKNLLLTALLSGYKTDFLDAADLLNQAVARDPSFFQAYCQLAYAHDALYFFALDHTAARLALAEAAIQAAVRLRPDAGETHLARAQNLYWGYLDYDGALTELEGARRTLPNDPRVFALTGYIERRQGRFEESLRSVERAIELDPRNVFMLADIAGTYVAFRRYTEAESAFDRALAIVPNDAVMKVNRAYVELDWKADTGPLHQIIDSIRATNPGALPSIAGDWLLCALAEHNAAAAKDALIAIGENQISLSGGIVQYNRPFLEGVIARMTNDDAKARSAFTAARAEQEKIVQAQPSYGPALCVLGLIDAGLGRKEEALREGRRAVELLPVEKDAIKGAWMVRILARIAAWVGDKDLACEQLATIIRGPTGPSYGTLKLLPDWDPLRGDPRFEKLMEESKKPAALK